MYPVNIPSSPNAFSWCFFKQKSNLYQQKIDNPGFYIWPELRLWPIIFFDRNFHFDPNFDFSPRIFWTKFLVWRKFWCAIMLLITISDFRETIFKKRFQYDYSTTIVPFRYTVLMPYLIRFVEKKNVSIMENLRL